MARIMFPQQYLGILFIFRILWFLEPSHLPFLDCLHGHRCSLGHGKRREQKQNLSQSHSRIPQVVRSANSFSYCMKDTVTPSQLTDEHHFTFNFRVLDLRCSKARVLWLLTLKLKKQPGLIQPLPLK